MRKIFALLIAGTLALTAIGCHDHHHHHHKNGTPTIINRPAPQGPAPHRYPAPQPAPRPGVVTPRPGGPVIVVPQQHK